MAFCGTCIDGTLDLKPNEDGVLECRTCRAEPARHITGPERGYDVERFDDPLRARGSFGSQVAKAAVAITGRTGVTGKHWAAKYNGVAKSAGHIVIRVPRYDASGRPIDNQQAWESLRDQPWFDEVSTIGTTAHYHLFQRPVPVAIPDDSDERELEELLEPFRVKDIA